MVFLNIRTNGSDFSGKFKKLAEKLEGKYARISFQITQLNAANFTVLLSCSTRMRIAGRSINAN